MLNLPAGSYPFKRPEGKIQSIVSVQSPPTAAGGLSSKIVPLLKGPPACVVPYKLPCLSKTRVPVGYLPSLESFWKACRTCSVQVPPAVAGGVNSNTVP